MVMMLELFSRDKISQNKALEAAQKAAEIFSSLDMYEAEEDATQVYNHVNNMKNQDNMVQIPVS
eukprot:10642960-Karenia_brevis.AAC.1